jgi:hypothetical protein
MAQQPHPLFIAHLRLVVTAIIRFIVLLIAGVAVVMLIGMFPALLGISAIGVAGGANLSKLFTLQALILILFWAPFPAAAIALYLGQRRLVAWLVPTPPPRRRHRCPACDYDTRYATGGRCPECGLQLEQP